MMHGNALCWLCLSCLIVALIYQTGSQKISENGKLTMDSDYNDKNSLVCEMVCRVEDTCNGVNHTKPAGCQCESAATPISETNDGGTIKAPQTSATQVPYAYVIFSKERLYWYGKDGKLMHEANLELAKEVLFLEVDNAQSPKTLYWIVGHPGVIYSADILSGEILTAVHTRIIGVRAFKVDSSTGLIIWTTGSKLRRCTLSGQNTSLLYKGNWIEDIGIDRIHRHIYVGDWDAVFVVNYYGTSLRKVIPRSIESFYYHEADETLYWETAAYEADDGRGWVHKSETASAGTERIIVEYDDLVCFHFTVHNQRIYFKADIERGISVVTLDGQQLPNLGSDEIRAVTGAQIIFL